MSGARLTYRFGPLERRGILGPVRAGQALPVGVGALLAVAVLDEAPSASGAVVAIVLFGSAIALALAPIATRTADEWAPIACAFALRRISGRVRFRSPAPTRGMLARTLRHGSVREDAWPDARVNEVWDQFDQGTQRAILRLVRSPVTELKPAPSGTQHALVIWGDRDPWYPPALAGAYAARLPGARIERLSDAGHWPWLDRSDLAERVATFLEE